MRFFYRISDNSYPKIKAPGATKRFCFENFLETFRPYDAMNCTVIADNCGPGTLEYLYRMQEKNPFHAHFSIIETAMGNAGALLACIERAVTVVGNDTLYFVEDDYLHDTAKAEWVLREGSYVSYEGYWTLYDHPDKYSHFYEYGEVGKVRKTDRSHWRESISTTMTFACNARTLADDVHIWHSFLDGAHHPNDHEIFRSLNEKGRKLNVAIPGVACHTDLTYSGVVSRLALDSWAVKLLFDRYYTVAMENEEVREHLKQFFGDQTPDPSLNNLTRVMAVLEGLTTAVHT